MWPSYTAVANRCAGAHHASSQLGKSEAELRAAFQTTGQGQTGIPLQRPQRQAYANQNSSMGNTQKMEMVAPVQHHQQMSEPEPEPVHQVEQVEEPAHYEEPAAQFEEPVPEPVAAVEPTPVAHEEPAPVHHEEPAAVVQEEAPAHHEEPATAEHVEAPVAEAKVEEAPVVAAAAEEAAPVAEAKVEEAPAAKVEEAAPVAV